MAEASIKKMNKREMGLKFPRRSGFLLPFLSKRMMASQHIEESNSSPYILFKAFVTNLQRSGQNSQSQLTVKPSTLGAEPPFINLLRVSVSYL